MSLGFIAAEIFMVIGYLSNSFAVLCVFAFFGAFLNAAGNSVFNAALMLALPEKNRGALLGFVSSASVGGVALSSLIYGFLGDIFPLYLVFAAGCLLSIAPMVYVFFHPKTKEFILSH